MGKEEIKKYGYNFVKLHQEILTFKNKK